MDDLNDYYDEDIANYGEDQDRGQHNVFFGFVKLGKNHSPTNVPDSMEQNSKLALWFFRLVFIGFILLVAYILTIVDVDAAQVYIAPQPSITYWEEGGIWITWETDRLNACDPDSFATLFIDDYHTGESEPVSLSHAGCYLYDHVWTGYWFTPWSLWTYPWERGHQYFITAGELWSNGNWHEVVREVFAYPRGWAWMPKLGK